MKKYLTTAVAVAGLVMVVVILPRIQDTVSTKIVNGVDLRIVEQELQAQADLMVRDMMIVVENELRLMESESQATIYLEKGIEYNEETNKHLSNMSDIVAELTTEKRHASAPN